MPNGQPVAVRETDRIDVTHDYAMCAWARHFNVSEHDVRQAVAAVGDTAVRVKEHLSRGRAGSQAYREGPNAN
jgi:hypothetical protein